MKHLKLEISICLFLTGVLGVIAQNSPLAEGNWYKIEVGESGLYKIDYALLQQMGLQNKKPNEIKVYGYGHILPQKNGDFRYGDIVENPVKFVGGNDGVINPGDYVLFYAQGPDMIEDAGNTLIHDKNPYSRSSYYYITANAATGKRVELAPASIEEYTRKSDVLPFLIYYEDDQVNVVKSGREWLGNPFKYKPSYTFNFNLQDIKTDSIVKYSVLFAGGSENYLTEFKTSVNNVQVASSGVSYIAVSYGPKANLVSHDGDVKLSNSALTIKTTYDNKGDGGAEGYLDYIRLTYFRKLNGALSTVYAVPELYRQSELELFNTSASTLVWDVSRIDKTKEILVSNGRIKIDSEVSKLLIANVNNVKSPGFIGKVINQNLHGIEVPELLIVTHSNFLASALAMAKFKNEQQGISTQVVTTEQIYNEYSSGSQDISAIRDFARDLYQRDNKFHFLLLFGDCSYDYLGRDANNTNFVPIYQSRSSLNNTTSFSSDDYFGFLEDGEGIWEEGTAGTENLELGIGRLPIQSNEQGYKIITKIKNYIYNQENQGNWRNKIVFVADDGDSNLHAEHSNDLSLEIQKLVGEFNVSKIYLDAFEQISSSGGQIAPRVNQELDLKVKKGALIVNYSGHGSEEQWTQEQILTIGEIRKLNNKTKLPFYITATCEFGRYDDPLRESGAEALLFNENGGAIGLMTTTRPVYANSNYTINSSFYKNAFIRNSDSLYDYLGEVQRRTKNGSIVSFYNRNFALLGDPTLKLSYPSMHVRTDSINGQSISKTDTLSALENVVIKGHIRDIYNKKDTTFTGKIILTVYDKEIDVTTLGDRGEAPFNFKERNSILFEGESKVVKGEYTVEFVVPKDISYFYGLGKLSFYAVSEDGRDANGALFNVLIGGGLDGFVDDKGPELKIYVNDTTFKNGGVTNANPIFLAKIFDENGINTTNTGIGHEITLVIDDDNTNTFVLNDYYKSVGNSYKTGEVEYPLRDLSFGTHKLTFKVWDVNNNSSTAELYIVVSETGIVSVFPNPFNNIVNFTISQPRQEIGGQVDLKIYNTFGQEMWSQVVEFDSFTSVVDDIVWGADYINGEKITDGIYISVVEVRYDDGIGNIIEKSKLIKH